MKVFIPIKHNSQRVSGKNFRLFGTEPLFKHTLLKYTDCEIYVDTDSDEIMTEVVSDPRLKNVTVFKRREHLKGDTTSVCELIRDFIQRFEISHPIVQIHVTSPFLQEDTLRNAYSYLGDYDSVISCTPHQVRFWRKEKYGMCPVNHNPSKMEQTQDLPIFYEENSAFYIFNPEALLQTGNRVGLKPYFYPIDKREGTDIDTEEDWKEAMRMLRK